MSDEKDYDGDKTIFKYGVQERVQTCFGKLGIIKIAGVDAGGKGYLVRTDGGEDWYQEDELVSLGADMNNTPPEMYLTEEKSENKREKIESETRQTSPGLSTTVIDD